MQRRNLQPTIPYNLIDDPVTEEGVIFNQQMMGIGSARGLGPRRVDYLPKENRSPSTKQSLVRAERKMNDIVKKSEQILFTTQTVFPFDLFPDSITISGNKIEISNSNFFASHQTSSIPLRDIANVEIQTSPFFASLKIINIRYPMHPHILQYLKKRDAIKAKNIIDGLLVAMSQGADITQIETHKLIEQIEKVGRSAYAQ